MSNEKNMQKPKNLVSHHILETQWGKNRSLFQ